jgi:outer membrane protein assembly factor BamB
VVDEIRMGGSPLDAVVAGDAVWVADASDRQVVRIDRRSREVVERRRVGGQPFALAAGPSGVWVRTSVGDGGTVGRVDGGPPVRVGYGTTLAAGSATVWAPAVELPPEGIHQIDAETGRDRGLLARRGVYALAIGGDSMWAVTNDGTVLRMDPESGTVRARFPAVAISAGTADPALVADDRGAWTLRVGQGDETQAIRFEGDRIVRRVPVDPSARPLLAHGAGGLWTATDDALLRIDPSNGAVTARLDSGGRLVTAVRAVGDELWAFTEDGSVLVVSRA